MMMAKIWFLLWLASPTSSFQLPIQRTINPDCHCYALQSSVEGTNDEPALNNSVEGTTDDEPPLNNDHLFSLDPDSDQARQIIVKELGLAEETYEQLAKLSHVVTDLNQQVNLVSRKDCSPETMFGRHVLPCVAAFALEHSPLETANTAVDVGTGGGFPGLVLAILYPNTEFVLLDSVGKKLTAVQEAADTLQLTNVKTHHGRAEDYEGGTFDVATGRSVAKLSQFCGWMSHLLPKGNLLYWIGGEIPENILKRCIRDEPVGDLVPALESSDKRILIFPAKAVQEIAKESGLLRSRKSSASSSSNKNENKNKKKHVKGAWKSKDRNEPKQRGYENFRRVSFTAGSSGNEESS
jgi:16S rRNA (guanine527-N7)-methyltransferase